MLLATLYFSFIYLKSHNEVSELNLTMNSYFSTELKNNPKLEKIL